MYQIRMYLVSAVPTQPAASQGEGCSSSEAAATRRRETDEARPLGYLSAAVVTSLLAHSSSSRKVRRAWYRP